MIKANKDIVDKLNAENQEFNALFKEHIKLEQDLEALGSLKYLPPEVEQKIKEIKIIKLRGKDRMMKIISDYNSTKR